MSSQEEYIKLEERFKFLSETHEFDFEPADWNDLKDRLDDDDRKKRPFILLFSIGTLALFLLSAWMWTSSAPNEAIGTINNENHGIGQQQEAIASGQSAISASQQLAPTADELQVDERINDVGTSQIRNQLEAGQSQDSDITIQSPELSEKLLSTNESGSSPVKEQKQEFSLVGPQVLNRPPNNSNAGSSELLSEEENSLSQNYKESTAVDEHKESTAFDKAVSEVASDNKVIDLHNIASLTILPFAVPHNLDEALSQLEGKIVVEESDDSEYRTPRFLINLNAGVEVAQTQLGGVSDTDFNYGLKLGYITGSKLVVTAGANYIEECYLAEGGDYAPPSGFWSSTEGRGPEQILAVCDMIDVSLGASYHFTDVRSSGFVAHLNLNSNFMIREEYEYMFTESGENWTGIFRNDSQTILSNVELGTTYKIRTGDGLFIDAGPYFKIPLRGVGHGNVKLASVGFRIGVSLVK